jgi:hypothetical protein
VILRIEEERVSSAVKMAKSGTESSYPPAVCAAINFRPNAILSPLTLEDERSALSEREIAWRGIKKA